ncbi:DNA glycosylase AlkZ-like family protein [Pseudonocardia nigra]|uniref:DNA glycosylase AlkZ-like family protein n=1 Tax=Pseudonocardia nigra TaxID=1921578 RepID=UPI001C5E8FC6|nr:crosslink repair DNA glycosylase YcaQ family protein [Pseudonocardia nigra]
MSAVLTLTRDQVVAHRVAVQGLVSRAAALPEVAVLDLGVQDTPPGALRAAVSARLAEPLAPDADLTAGGALTLAWSHRGAPHLHRTAALPALAAAGWPRDDADAAARLGWQRARLAAVGGAARPAFRAVADAVRAVLDRPLTKGELSAAVTARIPPELAPFCRPCGTHHVSEQLLRLAALPAGARLRAGARPLLVEPIPDWAGPPADTAAGSAELQALYLRFFGAGSDADVAAFLGTSRAAVAPDRPPGLVPARVDGRTAAVPEELVDAVRSAVPAEVVRLLPPSDPLVQGRDRALLVPDPAHRKLLWPTLGPPGIVLSRTEVAAAWRATQRGRVLEVAVQELRTLGAAERAQLEQEAQRLAHVRGARETRVTIGSPGAAGSGPG